MSELLEWSHSYQTLLTCQASGKKKCEIVTNCCENRTSSSCFTRKLPAELSVLQHQPSKEKEPMQLNSFSPPHTPSFRSVDSEAVEREVAGRARPEDHCFKAAIGSAINFDNGTKPLRAEAMSRSVGSFERSNALNMASRNTASISAPVKPAEARLSCWRS